MTIIIIIGIDCSLLPLIAIPDLEAPVRCPASPHGHIAPCGVSELLEASAAGTWARAGGALASGVTDG